MAVYHFTLHAYRSWNADNPRGYVRVGEGILPPDLKRARFYDRQATSPPVLFTQKHQRVILWIVWDACRRRGWRLHQFAAEPTHVHILVSWHEHYGWSEVRGKLKNLISWALTMEFSGDSRPWLTRRGSRKRVSDSEHFQYLTNRYLPRHRGLKWREGEARPIAPSWAAGLPSASADGY